MMTTQLYDKLLKFINDIEDKEIKEQLKQYVETDLHLNTSITCADCRFHGNCTIEKELSFSGNCRERFCSYGRK